MDYFAGALDSVIFLFFALLFVDLFLSAESVFCFFGGFDFGTAFCALLALFFDEFEGIVKTCEDFLHVLCKDRNLVAVEISTVALLALYNL